MTSIVSIVAAFMATFVLVFGYLSFSGQDVAPAEANTPVASLAEPER